MSYATYAFLKAQIEIAQQKLLSEYHIALSFIPETSKSQRALETAHGIFRKRDREYENMKDELLAAVQDNHRNHPNKEMREFWMIKE